MKGKIELRGLEFHAFHGCLPEERENGNLFVVDFSGVCDVDAAAVSDDLADAVDYAAVYDVIAAEMAEPSNLIEHACARIVRAVTAAFPQFSHVSVRLSKHNPPVSGKAEWSSITIENE